MIYIAATGAGAGAQQEIWRVPGCSEYFAGACFPYGKDQLEDFLGYAPEKSCCEEVAIEMAMMAYYKSWKPDNEYTVGIGLTGAVASSKPRRGENRSHVAMMTKAGVKTFYYGLDNGHGAVMRERHGRFADKLILDLIDGNHGSLGGDVTPRATSLFLSRPYWSQQGWRSALPLHRALYPGAFNPPHQGHLAIAKASDAIFWVEAAAPHKPELTLAELVQRAKLLHGQERFFTRGYPLYLDKSRAFPDRELVVGADSLLRMLDPKWGPDPLQLLRHFTENGTTLAIVGRWVGDRFVSADEAIASVPESGTLYNLRPLTGRWDISSTEVRNAASDQGRDSARQQDPSTS